MDERFRKMATREAIARGAFDNFESMGPRTYPLNLIYDFSELEIGQKVCCMSKCFSWEGTIESINLSRPCGAVTINWGFEAGCGCGELHSIEYECMPRLFFPVRRLTDG